MKDGISPVCVVGARLMGGEGGKRRQKKKRVPAVEVHRCELEVWE
jgi:hypothetical protein